MSQDKNVFYSNGGNSDEFKYLHEIEYVGMWKNIVQNKEYR